MKASDVIASKPTKERLGPALGEVCGWLWSKDCQTCGRPIGRQRPALCVDSLGASTYTSLHHPACRRAQWSDSGGIGVSGANLSWTSRAWPELPLVRGNGNEAEADPRPFVLVNPGLELVFLKHSSDGWAPELPAAFAASGLQPVGEVLVDRPVAGMTASLSRGTAAVRQLVPPFETYTTQADSSFTRRVREKRGLIFGVTHTVDPSSPVTGDEVNMLMLTGTVLLGWVSLR